ncbi:hypothetical protein CR513_31459, partial [Mucuna pruriens]
MENTALSKKQLIAVANGDHVPIVGSGNIQLQSSLSLHNVLHVLKLANNLISIHRLIQDWNYSELKTRRMIRVAKEQCGLYYLQHTKIGNTSIRKIFLPVNSQAQKHGQLLKFGFTINVLDIHRLGYLRQCFHIYLQKCLSSPLSVMFVSFQSNIVQHFLLIIIKVLNLLSLFILMYEGQLVTLYRGPSDLYCLLMIVPV